MLRANASLEGESAARARRPRAWPCGPSVPQALSVQVSAAYSDTVVDLKDKIERKTVLGCIK